MNAKMKRFEDSPMVCQQAEEPHWFSYAPVALSATSGTSPFNEWAGFDNEDEAREKLADWVLESTKDHQVECIKGENGWQFFHRDDCEFPDDEDVNPDWEVRPKAGATEMDLQEVFRALSRF